MNAPHDPAVVAGARIAAGDTLHSYGRVAKALHWTTVVLVLIQFGLSQLWSLFGRPAHHLMVVAHMSFGILLGAVVIFRIVWRLMPGHQVDGVIAGWVETASKGVHWLLYGLLLGEFVLGFVLRWSGGEAMSFFGLQLPPLIAQVSRPTHHLIGEIHEKVGWGIIIVALGHAAAALYHHFVVKDDVLVRMLPGRHAPRRSSRTV